MAFIGKLRLGSIEHDLLHCHFSLRRNIDGKGKPSSKIYGSTIHLSVVSNESTVLIEFMLNNQSRPINGSVVIVNISQEKNAKEIFFKQAYIIEYSEKIDLVSPFSQKIDLTLSARTIRIGAAEHSNEWTD